MTDRQWIIGCDRDVDVLVRDSVVSRRHCRLSLHGSHYFIEDLASRNGTFIGDKRIVTRTEVQPGVKVMLADSVLMPWPDETHAEQKWQIGRAASNDIVIDDPSVSSHHAVLFRDPNGVWIVRDLGSTNGISLGDHEPVTSAARVSNDDVIRFGSVAETLSSLRRNVASHASNVPGTTEQPRSNDQGPQSLSRDDAAPTSSPQSRPGGDTTAVLRKQNIFHAAIRYWKSLPQRVAVAVVSVAALIAVLGLWSVAGSGPAEINDTSVAATEPTENGSEQPASKNRDPATASAIGENNPASTQRVEQAGVLASNGQNPGVAPDVTLPRELPVKVGDFESAIRDCMYQVIAISDGNRFGLGMALAVDSHRLLTTGNVVENMQRMDATIEPVCRHLASTVELKVDESALHPRWMESRRIERQCLDWLKDFQSRAAVIDEIEGPEKVEVMEQRDKVYRTALATQMLARVFDAAVIRAVDELPSHLAAHMEASGANASTDDASPLQWVATRKKPLRPMASHRLLGAFFKQDDPYLQPDVPVETGVKKVQPLFLLPRITTDMPPLYIGRMPNEAGTTLDFSGGVILDDRGRLAGMLSTPAKLDQSQKDKIGRLVSDRDMTFDWISLDVLADLLANPSLAWSPVETVASESP
ncbi:FHA domain-containing protein [Aporhodopirellula aestuarii]|uniref:FHA domain-containing protein n=1 Tax=Aporhodopirellula aestuarii TaxID=2950107 RepID=A0ABT0U4Q6_9BACT|nr:FHA domain-containing protein [Aporhodopirellula aestuarii]MCM2371841.1 FHA domain-containing protein [Aporhodopirellula aestuarii]